MCDGNCVGCNTKDPVAKTENRPQGAPCAPPLPHPPVDSEFDRICSMVYNITDECHMNMDRLSDRLSIAVSSDECPLPEMPVPEVESSIGRRLVGLVSTVSKLSLRIKDLEDRIVI